MKNRFFASAAIAVLSMNVVGLAFTATSEAGFRASQAARLVSMLPASDGVVVFDSKRFLNDALPKVLSANQPMLGEIMAKITEMEGRTGIDLRKFDQVAVGVAIKRLSATNHDFDSVVIASGDINAGGLVAVAKLASKGTYREEKLGDKTVYVFSSKDALPKTTVPVTNSKVARIFDKAIKGLTKEIAVTALDRNTLVLGSLARVREMLGSGSRVASDVSGLISGRETAVMSFALKTPAGLSRLLPLSNDELGANIDSIQYLSGSLDVAAAGASVQMMARTKGAAQASGLKDTLEGLQMIGGAFLGSSKRLDQQVFGRMVKSAKFEARGTDVTLDLLVPQSDIDILVGGIK